MRFGALTIEVIYDEQEWRVVMRFGDLIIEMVEYGKTWLNRIYILIINFGLGGMVDNDDDIGSSTTLIQNFQLSSSVIRYKMNILLAGAARHILWVDKVV